MNEWMNEWMIEVAYKYNWILFSHKEEENLAIWDNMDGTWGHNAKWNKSDRER